jgi:hypothetical protein
MPSSPHAGGASLGLRLLSLVIAAAPVWAAPAGATPPERPAPPTGLSPSAVAYTPSPGLVEESLRRRLEREARRQRLGFAQPFVGGPGDEVAPEDPDGSERRVQRAFTRALSGALDDRLEEVARDSALFGPLFRFIDRRDLGSPTADFVREPAPLPDSVSPFATATPCCVATTPEPPQRGPADVALGLRLDAHPRLVLGTRFGVFTGRVELPLLDRAPRLSLDRPVGEHGWASLQGGHSEDRGAWADLSLQFRF